jgi:hypothetical protein
MKQAAVSRLVRHAHVLVCWDGGSSATRKSARATSANTSLLAAMFRNLCFAASLRIGRPEAIPREMSSRSAGVSGSRERRRAAGGMPPRGSNTEPIQLCGVSNARPISCSDCPAFHRLQTSPFSSSERPNRCPGFMPTPHLQFTELIRSY